MVSMMSRRFLNKRSNETRSGTQTQTAGYVNNSKNVHLCHVPELSTYLQTHSLTLLATNQWLYPLDIHEPQARSHPKKTKNLWVMVNKHKNWSRSRIQIQIWMNWLVNLSLESTKVTHWMSSVAGCGQQVLNRAHFGPDLLRSQFACAI